MNIDKLYSDNAVEDWKIVLGDKLHYHMGLLNDKNIDFFDYVPLRICESLQDSSSVLDCGCGWGESMRVFKEQKNCSVEGITISKQQKNYIKDFIVYCEDLEHFIPTKKYDYATFIASYQHLSFDHNVFKNLAPFVKTIIVWDEMRTNGYNIEIPQWGVRFRSEENIYKDFEDAGYKIVTYEKIILPYNLFAERWLEGLNKLPTSSIFGQLATLKAFCEFAIKPEVTFEGFNGILLIAQKV